MSECKIIQSNRFSFWSKNENAFNHIAKAESIQLELNSVVVQLAPEQWWIMTMHLELNQSRSHPFRFLRCLHTTNCHFCGQSDDATAFYVAVISSLFFHFGKNQNYVFGRRISAMLFALRHAERLSVWTPNCWVRRSDYRRQWQSSQQPVGTTGNGTRHDIAWHFAAPKCLTFVFIFLCSF